ncbi:Aste57867_2362 [Aphanomyces stellatus]|uniref:Aste57867_2362 protein n=1 Tax=Aphanomyces stellatus TaxID=120398 RepID=A0A485K7H2_9STRA|nr:hypothetical protein As57867_002357 [Aphanomyces stellatus]VFT79563.1 Aste57867_2362 [Aphanomyces stellatus]
MFLLFAAVAFVATMVEAMEVATLGGGGGNLASFYVCDSSVDALNGVYELDDAFHSDDAPVFIRVDDDDVTTTDFRLFRYQGFWSFANFAEWPPAVHFRCDPFQNMGEESGFCGVDQADPPLAGYSAREPAPGVQSPVLQFEPCGPSRLKLEL